MKYTLCVLISLFAFTAATEERQIPSSGTYYYCAPDAGEVRIIDVTMENSKDLGLREITLLCDAQKGSTCSLNSLSRRSVQIKNDQQFVWSPKEANDCGAGCSFKPILFSKSESDIKDCKGNISKASDDSTLDCGDPYFGTQDQCDEIQGQNERAEFDKQIEAYAKKWPAGTRDAVLKMKKLVAKFAVKEADWTMMAIHGGYPGLVAGNQRRYFINLIREMEQKWPLKEEAAEYKTVDDKLNAEYQRVQKENGPNEKTRVAQRLWLKIHDQLGEVFQKRFKGRMSESDLKRAAFTRISKLRIEDFKAWPP